MGDAIYRVCAVQGRKYIRISAKWCDIKRYESGFPLLTFNSAPHVV
ncbi:hypothetical protein NIES3974_39690 [Calothrix sp. NIES-3974]|nr:hypothetical protein NIES3974_39690 [Calothrix sp. NIES-3974]